MPSIIPFISYPSMRYEECFPLPDVEDQDLSDDGQEEAERLETQYRVLRMIFDGKLVFPPMSDLRKVLDLGYGTGSWATDLACEEPNSKVRNMRHL